MSTTTTADPAADRRFMDFHNANPRVLATFVEVARELAQQARAKGWKPKLGAKHVWEVMRWRIQLETNDPDYKLNNSYLSRLVRLAVRGYPDLAGVFETRRLKVAPGELPLGA